VKAGWLAIGVLGLGVMLGAAAWNASAAANPWLVIRVQASVLIFGFGLLLLVLGSIEWLRSRHFEQRLNFLRKESEEERRRFLRRLDHELKNPLTSILAGLANLDSDESEEDRQSTRRSIQSQVQRMRDLLADLRKLAELETRPIESGRVDLAEILRESREMVLEKPGAGDRRIDLTVPHAPWPLPLVSGDRDLLFLAVHNLVENAVKFTEAGARIELRAYEDGSNAIIEVADTGPGIPDEERALIWEELYRGRAASGLPGSGLGLALVRSIAEKHGGKVLVRSRPGQGTVFSLTIPIDSVI